jgi:hypothetical protein
MKNAIPTLSTQGWVDDLPTMVDRQLAYYYVSDYNQTFFFPGQVYSLGRDLQISGGKVEILMDLIKTNITALLKEISGNVRVEASCPDFDDETSGRKAINVRMAIEYNGQELLVGRVLEIRNGKLANVLRMNNG